jgi:hypothetical protein
VSITQRLNRPTYFDGSCRLQFISKLQPEVTGWCWATQLDSPSGGLSTGTSHGGFTVTIAVGMLGIAPLPDAAADGAGTAVEAAGSDAEVACGNVGSTLPGPTEVAASEPVARAVPSVELGIATKGRVPASSSPLSGMNEPRGSSLSVRAPQLAMRNTQGRAERVGVRSAMRLAAA